jgi:Uma2 family endonuclease
MSAEPIPTSPGPWCPDPMRQQRADYTLEDLLTLPDDAPRVELVDGVIQATPSPTLGHQDICGLSPGTRRIDRFAKPGEYAAAGIPFYWRIEQDPVHVYAYRIGDRVGPGGERQYELVADGADVIELTEPFDMKLPIAEITP